MWTVPPPAPLTTPPLPLQDKTAILWSVRSPPLGGGGPPPLQPIHVLREHLQPVAFLSWSPDDSLLLTCRWGLGFGLGLSSKEPWHQYPLFQCILVSRPHRPLIHASAARLQ